MRRLMLLRHAKSDWTVPGARDRDRPLNARGREAAPKMGAYNRFRLSVRSYQRALLGDPARGTALSITGRAQLIVP